MMHMNLLNEYINGYNLINNKIKNISKNLLLFKPDIKNSWSIKEHIIHVVDSEINNFIRWKSILAQPFSTCFVIEEETWTKNLNYEKENLKKYLLIFKLLRELTFEYLKDINEKEWGKNYFIHNFKNKKNKINLKCTIEIYTNHVYDHLKFIDRNINEYNKFIKNSI